MHIGRFFILSSLLAYSTLGFSESEDPYSEFPLVDDYRWRMLSGISGTGSQPLTLEQLHQAELKLNGQESDETIMGRIRRSTITKSVQCMSATGNVKLCRCLSNKLPTFLTFSSYIAIVTGQKGLQFSPGLNADEIQKLVNNTIKAREQCIAE